ncbi:uncharacterized protein LOC113467541 [Diaphorina citri]|uniref:Uncharacterized protein LOC113467541 n=1 Tax=Diaphorina citri TaxID=121845 RepID=A0A3Q0IY15_DIACI|nr:uncharacterized protein LOC113467541 [Diaphorina citri]
MDFQLSFLLFSIMFYNVFLALAYWLCRFLVITESGSICLLLVYFLRAAMHFCRAFLTSSFHQYTFFLRVTLASGIDWLHTDSNTLIRSQGVSNSETTSSMEQERYLSILVSLTPLAQLRQSCGWGMSDSSLSINSLLLAAEDNTLTPENSRRSNPFSKPMSTMG